MKIKYNNKIYQIYAYRDYKYIDYDKEHIECQFLIYNDFRLWEWININECIPVDDELE